jgi:hypothetical protein
METLRLTANRPEVIALAFQQGKPVTSHLTGEEQMMFTLMGDRRIYLDTAIARKIDEMSLGKGEPFELTKCVDRNKKVTYEVRYLQQQEPPQQTQPPARPSVQTQPSNSGSREVVHTQEQHNAPAAKTTGGKLMACFMSSIDAIAEAQAYATRRGLGITFTAEDVRAAAISAYITACKEGR